MQSLLLSWQTLLSPTIWLPETDFFASNVYQISKCKWDFGRFCWGSRSTSKKLFDNALNSARLLAASCHESIAWLHAILSQTLVFGLMMTFWGLLLSFILALLSVLPISARGVANQLIFWADTVWAARKVREDTRGMLPLITLSADPSPQQIFSLV